VMARRDVALPHKFDTGRRRAPLPPLQGRAGGRLSGCQGALGSSATY